MIRRRRWSIAGAARVAVAPIVSGFVAAILFLIMIQGAFRRGYTDLDFNHVLGTLIVGEEEEIGSTNEALGVIGDPAGPAGLWTTILAAMVLMLVHGLVIVPLTEGRHWVVRSVPLAVLTSLAIGLLFCGVAEARFDTPIGLFGVDAGGTTPLVIVCCAIGFALMGARAHDLAGNASWWEERPDPLAAASLEEVAGITPAPDRTPD